MQSLHLHPCDTCSQAVNLAQKGLLPTPTREVGCENNQKPDSFRGVLFLVIRFAFFFFLNGKRDLDRWNQKELLQTPKNREAHNILNICHATHASRVNSYACKHERVGPQPFAATPPQHLAAMAVPCWLLLLPRKASSSGEHRGLTTVLHSQHQATGEKPPNHSIWKLNAVEERQYICYFLFSSVSVLQGHIL